MTAQARRVAVGDNTPTADIEAGKQDISPLAVLGAEDGPVEGKAGRLSHKVGAERLLPGTLEDENVGAEDLAWCDLSIGVGVGAGGVDDFSLLLGVSLDVEEVRRGEGIRTSFVNVRHSFLGTPPISLRTRVLGPRTGPRGTTTIWAVEVAMAPRRAMLVVNFMLCGLRGLGVRIQRSGYLCWWLAEKRLMRSGK